MDHAQQTADRPAAAPVGDQQRVEKRRGFTNFNKKPERNAPLIKNYPIILCKCSIIPPVPVMVLEDHGGLGDSVSGHEIWQEHAAP